MAQVTIPGLSGPAVTVTGSAGGDVLTLAQLVANALNGATVVGTETSISGSIPTSPSPPAGGKTELVIRDTVTGTINVPVGPPGYNYTVVDDPNATTINATSQVVVTNALAGNGQYNLLGNATLVAAGGNNLIDTGSSQYVIATGNGNDSILASGQGNISPGGGTNVIRSTGDDVIFSTGTNDFVAAYGQSTSVQASGSGLGVIGNTFDALSVTLENSATNAVILANGADLFATVHGSGHTLLGDPGAFNVTDGLASDTVATATSDTISAYVAPAPVVGMYGASGVLFGGSGTLHATVGGTANTIVGGSGNATVTGFAGAQASVPGNMVALGDGALTFLGGPQTSTVFGGVGNLTYVGGAGAATVIGTGAGTEAITVGGGNLLFAAGVGNQSTITSGAGAVTLFGSSNNSVINFTGSATGAIYVAGVGNETLNASGSSTHNFIVGGADSTGHDSLVGGSGNDTVLVGRGSDTITTGAGQDLVAFFKGNTNGGHDYITDFNQSSDSVYILGYDSTKSASYLVNNASTVGGGVTLTLSDSTQITFTSLTSASQLYGTILSG